MNKKLYKLMNWPEIEAIVYSEEKNPHKLLGVQKAGTSTLFQTFQPDAKKIYIHIKGEKKAYPMDMVDEAGYFAALLPCKSDVKYTYEVLDSDGMKSEIVDPYCFVPVITKKDEEKFAAGIHYRIYDLLGAHPMTIKGTKGIYFAVWAPNAMRVSVVGDFNRWDGRVHQMRRLEASGIFEIFIPAAKVGDLYKFELKLKGDMTYLKSDPYAFGQQLRPDNASIIRDLSSFKWEDKEYLHTRRSTNIKEQPMSVYELHLGSFQKPEDGREFYSYRELAPMIISYVKEMGYTHIELMPVMEHPLDASWGYQVIGYYAPTSRYGTADEFMYFMNEMHKAGIGVILDWVPAHFPRDTHGLSNFDGTCLYEHQDPRQGFHPHWGTLIYNYGREEVCNYLIANALYWVEKYHADGIRIDAVASMLYLDYGKNDGEWVANMYGGNENLEAIEFFKHLNSIMHDNDKSVLMIAEESTAFPQITGNLKDGGLGFDYKWNMGWMNDMIGFMQYDPFFRGQHYHELTFSMIYAYSEKFMLVFSHDEVVHGKASMIGKMPGEKVDKFHNLRLVYGYMMTHPGKKLLFMGQDIAEFDEWNEARSVEWDLLQYEEHKQFQDYVKALNALYQTHPALFAKDETSDGFAWINCISTQETVIAFLRKSKKEDETLLIVCNFANVERTDYRVGVPFAGRYKEIFNSDSKQFGGSGCVNARTKASKCEKCDDRENSLSFSMPALGIQVFSCIPYTEEDLKKIEQQKKEKEKKAKEAAIVRANAKKERAEVLAKAKEEALRMLEQKNLKEAARKEKNTDTVQKDLTKGSNTKKGKTNASLAKQATNKKPRIS